MRSYIEPKVSLLDSSIQELGYILWLRSRQWIIKDLNGTQFMRDLTPELIKENGSKIFSEFIPDEFYVGGELVNKIDYMNRINKMNLQYNNMENYVFEIDGSCLFRDILFNINRIAQWAQSNRFLFSILDENARFEEEHYHISKEYKGIPEWEEQFDLYMKAIKEDPIVDHNRLEMPYSISSTFWISINKKTLQDLLIFLKKDCKFFYDVYGTQFLSELGWKDSDIQGEYSAAIKQYYLKHEDEWEESVNNINGTYIVNSYMGLILFSQFIRQADTRIAGLYNIIKHDNVDEFKKKVFKGSTVFKIHYVADESKVLSTVKTRLCAFAMSSDNGPCSWSYFLNHFIPEDVTPEWLMNMLPCTFKNGKLVHCKFHDDIKFRNEGKEISNCPCPLAVLSLRIAERKCERDNNLIGNAYYDLTKYLLFEGFTEEYVDEKWTSKLIIRANRTIPGDVLDKIYHVLDKIENDFSFFKIKELPKASPLTPYYKYGIERDGRTDLTCMLKGFAIDQMRILLQDAGFNSFLISFGGDIYGHNARVTSKIAGTKVNLHLDGKFSIFTSGNTPKRGDHIIGGNHGEFNTVVIKWEGMANNTISDIACTKLMANEFELYEEIREKLSGIGEMYDFRFTEGGLVKNSIYCASPFFNPTQVEIRDNMVSQFVNAFRPDLTESSLQYDKNHDNDNLVNAVVDDNIKGIEDSEYLVFPNNTNDLGTLYEVGHALSLGHPIFKYQESKDEYVVIFDKIINDIDYNKKYLFDCSKKIDAISMGALSNMTDKSNIYYMLNGAKDNIMLSVNYNHVEKDENGNFYSVTRDISERDE